MYEKLSQTDKNYTAKTSFNFLQLRYKLMRNMEINWSFHSVLFFLIANGIHIFSGTDTKLSLFRPNTKKLKKWKTHCSIHLHAKHCLNFATTTSFSSKI